MSWVVEEWKEGLSTSALQKIQELVRQLDKLKKEQQQRQFQLESLEACCCKDSPACYFDHVTSLGAPPFSSATNKLLVFTS
uniref:Centromere protein Cenp-F N-terminal domain-containing protein n=1 Tax=Gopherus evgoodei TaxID=1825980 RepID=A0A8C5EWY5_9SAUR